MENVERGLKRLDIVNHWISNVDAKCSFILAFLGVIITIVFTSSVGVSVAEVFSYKCASCVNCLSVMLFLKLALIITSLLFVLFAFFNIYKVLFARFEPTKTSQQGINSDSNLFFRTIAGKKFAEFEKQVNEESEEAFLNDLNSQIFINSQIATKKFKHYNFSIICTLISFCCLILFLFIHALLNALCI